jgi:hypothetical protein
MDVMHMDKIIEEIKEKYASLTEEQRNDIMPLLQAEKRVREYFLLNIVFILGQIERYDATLSDNAKWGRSISSQVRSAEGTSGVRQGQERTQHLPSGGRSLSVSCGNDLSDTLRQG